MRSRLLVGCFALIGLTALILPPTEASARVAPGERCRVEGVVRSGSASSVRCTLGARGTLRWRAISTSSPAPSTPATGVVAPLLLDVNASWDRGVSVAWLAGKPSQGVVSLQWSTSPTFDRYDTVRALGTRTTISADWFAAHTTYFLRAFEMSASWQRGPHSNENITGYSNVLSFTLGDRPASASRALVWLQRGSDIDGQADNEVFGSSVDISDDGTVVVVGSPNGGTSSAGIVRVYAWDGTSWVQRGGSFNSSAGDRLGEAVAISGDGLTIAMAAPRSDVGVSDNGQVNVYAWNGTSWVQRGSSLVGAGREDEFAQALALSYDGTMIVASAQNGAAGTGYVRVYQLSAGSWSLYGSQIDGGAGDRTGLRSVAISSTGDYVAIGAPSAAYVKVYTWNFTDWGTSGPLTVFGALNQEFGRSIALADDGLTLAVGSPTAPGGGTERGLTRIFRWGGSSWTQLGSDINGGANGEQSGWSVALSGDGNTVAIGARLADVGGVDSGTTRVYSWQATPSEWALDATFVGEAAGDISGNAVSLSSNGRIVASGGYYNAAGGSQRGHVRVYSYE
jgi:hypothetical protein